MLVDDSSVIRRAISNILESDPNIKIVASVSNGELAIVMAKNKQPDITILDVEMPVMDGLTALPGILKEAPKSKVIMFSSLTAKGANTTMKAMALGAVECLVKPSGADATGPNSPFKIMLLNLIKSLAPRKPAFTSPARPATQGDRDVNRLRNEQTFTAPTPQTNKFTLRDGRNAFKGKPSILAIGSSTGGPKALFKVLSDLGTVDVPVVITQHMPATFTKILAQHITQQTSLEALEGEEGMEVEPGKVYVAPGDRHMIFEKKLGKLFIKLSDGPDENFCKPSVDPMMRSLVELYGNRVLCVILTGMGHDGLEGAKALVDQGGRIIAQDEETSVVWGMPGAVAMAGICSKVMPLQEIGAAVKRICH